MRVGSLQRIPDDDHRIASHVHDIARAGSDSEAGSQHDSHPFSSHSVPLCDAPASGSSMALTFRDPPPCARAYAHSKRGRWSLRACGPWSIYTESRQRGDEGSVTVDPILILRVQHARERGRILGVSREAARARRVVQLGAMTAEQRHRDQVTAHVLSVLAACGASS